MNEASRATLAVAGLAMLWGSIGVVVRQIDISAVASVAVRAGVGALALGAWLAWSPPSKGLSRAPMTWSVPVTARIVANGLVLAAHWVSLFAALQRVPIGTVLLITYLAPIGIAALAPRVLGEVVGRRVVLALGLAVAGTLAIAGPVLGTPDATGLALAAISATFYVALALTNKDLSSRHGGTRQAFFQLAVAAIVLAPLAIGAGWGDVSGLGWVALAVLGLVYTAFAVGAYLRALEHLPATQVAVLMYLEPVSAVAFGWALLAESPSPLTLVGGALVVAAGVIVALRPRPARSGVPHPEVVGVSR